MGRTRLPEYADAVRTGWTEGELLRLHLHELPRSLFDLPRERQVERAHSRFPGHALTPTGVMAIRCKQFHLPDL